MGCLTPRRSRLACSRAPGEGRGGAGVLPTGLRLGQAGPREAAALLCRFRRLGGGAGAEASRGHWAGRPSELSTFSAVPGLWRCRGVAHCPDPSGPDRVGEARRGKAKRYSQGLADLDTLRGLASARAPPAAARGDKGWAFAA